MSGVSSGTSPCTATARWCSQRLVCGYGAVQRRTFGPAAASPPPLTERLQTACAPCCVPATLPHPPGASSTAQAGRQRRVDGGRTASSWKSGGERPVEKTSSESGANSASHRRLKASSLSCVASLWSTCGAGGRSAGGAWARRGAAARLGSGAAAHGGALPARRAHHRPVQVRHQHEPGSGIEYVLRGVGHVAAKAAGGLRQLGRLAPGVRSRLAGLWGRRRAMDKEGEPAVPRSPLAPKQGRGPAWRLRCCFARRPDHRSQPQAQPIGNRPDSRAAEQQAGGPAAWRAPW